MSATSIDVTAIPLQGRPVRSTDDMDIEKTLRSLASVRDERNSLLNEKLANLQTIQDLEAQVQELQRDKEQSERERIAADTKIGMLTESLHIKEAQCVKLGHDMVALTTEFSTIRHAVSQGLRVVQSTIGMAAPSAYVGGQDHDMKRIAERHGNEYIPDDQRSEH